MYKESKESISAQSDPDAPRTIYIGVIGVILVFVVIVALQVVFYYAEQQEIDRKAAEHGPAELQKLHATQLEQLHEYRWVDRTNTVVAIPIERAMDLVVQDLRAAADTMGK